MRADLDPANNDSDATLLLQARLLCDDPFFREVVWRHGAHLGAASDALRFDASIHAGDQRLLHSLQHHRDANASFSQYFSLALQQQDAAQQVLRTLFPGRAGQVSVLDFACGHGSVLRFLSLALPQVNLHAADVQPEALDFVCERFGARGHASPGTPGQFQPARTFQFIWVASLFKHLPPVLFDEWLARLFDCLAPDGVLCFSAHDGPVGASGGTPPASEAQVAGAIARACGSGHPYFRIARGVAHEQDLYVVAADPTRDLSVLAGFRRGPWGWADERRLSDDGELHLRGWAASFDDGPLDAVEITVDGVMYRCPTGLAREDVGRAFADPRLDRSGWEFRHVPPRGEGPVRVVVTAHTLADERALVFAGQFERPAALRRPQPWWRRLLP